MSEPISYAMRNAEATQALVYFNAPSQLKDWSFLAIEAIVLGGFLLALAHAIRYYKREGSPSALLTLLGCFLYGLLIDITSYYTVENFWHGEFSVMFLYNRLPLYIALFYPAFMYHAYMTIRRYNFNPITEAVSVGFTGGLAYLIFDNLGPMLGWWIWETTDPTTFPYLNSVPMTSYHWFFLFTAAFALINRWVSWEWVAARKSCKLIGAGVLLQPLATCLVGVLLFVPYNVIAQAASLGLAAGFHALAFSLAGLVFLFNYRRPAAPRDKLLLVFPLLWCVGQLYIYIAKFDLYFSMSPNGLSHEGLAMGNLIAAVVAIVASVAIALLSHPVEDGK